MWIASSSCKSTTNVIIIVFVPSFGSNSRYMLRWAIACYWEIKSIFSPWKQKHSCIARVFENMQWTFKLNSIKNIFKNPSIHYWILCFYVFVLNDALQNKKSFKQSYLQGFKQLHVLCCIPNSFIIVARQRISVNKHYNLSLYWKQFHLTHAFASSIWV